MSLSVCACVRFFLCFESALLLLLSYDGFLVSTVYALLRTQWDKFRVQILKHVSSIFPDVGKKLEEEQTVLCLLSRSRSPPKPSLYLIPAPFCVRA